MLMHRKAGGDHITADSPSLIPQLPALTAAEAANYLRNYN